MLEITLYTNGSGIALVGSTVVSQVDSSRPVLVECRREAVQRTVARPIVASHSLIKSHIGLAVLTTNDVGHVMSLALVGLQIIPERGEDCVALEDVRRKIVYFIGVDVFL